MSKFKGFQVSEYKVFLGSPSQKIFVDVTDIVSKIELFSSLYQVENHGTVMFNDTRGKLGNINFNGEEIIHLNLKSTNESKTFTFHMYKIDDYEPSSTNKIYKFVGHLASEFLYRSNILSITEGYKNISTSKIFVNVFNKLKIQGRKLVIENTKGVYKNYVIGKKMVRDIFPNLIKSAVSPKHKSPYVCFEDLSNNLYFCSIEYLIELNKNKNINRYTNHSFSTPDASVNNQAVVTFNKNSYYNVTNFGVTEKTDSVARAARGGYKNAYVSVDLLHRKVIKTEKRVDDLKDSNKNQSTSKEFNYSEMFLPSENSVTNVRYYNSEDIPEYISNNPINKLYYENFLQNQIAFTVYGDINTDVGNIFKFYAPKHGAVDATPDVNISGLYMIANLRHDFLNGNFYTTIEANRIGPDNEFS